jgi:hypothetical protein
VNGGKMCDKNQHEEVVTRLFVDTEGGISHVINLRENSGKMRLIYCLTYQAKLSTMKILLKYFIKFSIFFAPKYFFFPLKKVLNHPFPPLHQPP